MILAAEPATGWALTGYIFLILLMLGVIVLIGYALYRFGMWFVTIWYGDRFDLGDQSDPST